MTATTTPTPTPTPKLTALKCLAIPVALALLQVSLHAQTVWTSTTYGDWSNGANWSTTPNPPANDGTADIQFDFATYPTSANLNTGMDSATWSINSLTFNGGTTSPNYGVILAAGPLDGSGNIQSGQATNLTIGSGGISVTANTTANTTSLSLGYFTGGNDVTVTLGADQTWAVARAAGAGDLNNNSRIDVWGDLAGSGNLTKTGNGNLRFNSGASTSYTGTVTLQNGMIYFGSSSQLARLGPNALNWQNTGDSILGFANPGAGNHLTFSQDIQFSDTGTGNFNFRLPTGIPAAGDDSSMTLSGTYSGSLGDNRLEFAGATSLDGFYYKVTGNNNSWTSSLAGGYGNTASAIYLRSGHLVAGNANALGAGNSFSVSLGQDNSPNAGSTAGLYGTDGVTVGSDVYVLNNKRTGAVAADAYLGVQGTGDVTFSGDIGLDSTNNANYRLNNLHLTAGSGSSATFSGAFSDRVATVYSVPVIAEGGGKIVLSNADNTYEGGTSVIGGTTLLANGGASGGTSALGSGQVKVGFEAANTTVTTTSGSPVVSVASTSGLNVGQAVSGTGIDVGSVIVRVDSGTNTIELNKNATAAGSGVTLTAAATTGTLGGTGYIHPGAANGVVAANGSTVAPGASIGTLTLDGVDTSGSLLTMNSGSQFDFELAGDGLSADRIDFWNYSGISDFALNSNAINLTLSGAQSGGSYSVDLFRFYSDSGSTLTASGITSGLVLGTLDANITGATINYGTNNISLDYTVVPEPATAVLVGLGLSTLLLFRRRWVA